MEQTPITNPRKELHELASQLNEAVFDKDSRLSLGEMVELHKRYLEKTEEVFGPDYMQRFKEEAKNSRALSREEIKMLPKEARESMLSDPSTPAETVLLIYEAEKDERAGF